MSNVLLCESPSIDVNGLVSCTQWQIVDSSLLSPWPDLTVSEIALFNGAILGLFALAFVIRQVRLSIHGSR